MRSAPHTIRLAVFLAPIVFTVATHDTPAQQPAPAGKPAESVGEADFDTSRPPHGTVRDAQGAPIAGAAVSFRVGDIGQDSTRWRDAILRSQPLPSVRTSRDGEFFLPLTQLHRLFTPWTAGTICLVVEKEGFHPWVEPLPAGLRGYLGSRVVLDAIRAADRFDVTVKNPQPGMLVRVRRFGNAPTPGIDLEAWYEVPASGQVHCAMSFTPSPLFAGHGQTNLVTPIGIEAQLVFPGRTSTPTRVGFGEKAVVVGERAPNTRFVAVLRSANDAPVEEPRGLYRCPDGVARWFPVDPDNVVESAHLPLLAVTARDRLAVDVRYRDPEDETVALAAIPTGSTLRSIRLRDPDGAPVRDARASFFDLEALPLATGGVALGPMRARRRLDVEDGLIDIAGDAKLPSAGFLLIEAPGFQPLIRVEPRAIRAELELKLERAPSCGTVRLSVLDEDQRPLAGVHVVLQGRQADFGTLIATPPRTDARGQVVLEHVPIGQQTMRLTGAGLIEGTTNVRVDTGIVETRAVLHRAPPLRILVVDDRDRPMPFRALRAYSALPNVGRVLTPNLNLAVASDSEGRILVTTAPGSGTFRLMDQLGVSGIVGQQQIDDSVGVVRHQAAVLTPVMVPLPDAPVVRECLVSPSRNSNRNLSTRAGCATMLVMFPSGLGGATLSVLLQDAPPIRITDEILEQERKRQPTGILFLDQREEVRRVRFTLAGMGDADPGLTRIELPGLNFAQNRPYLYGNSGVRLRRSGTSGDWSVGFRDRGAWATHVMHPEFLLRELEVPAADKSGDEPVRLEMTRGTPVLFKLESSGRIDGDLQLNLNVQDASNQVVLYQREKLSEAGARETGRNEWELPMPFALAPGRYNVSLRVYGSTLNLARRSITVKAGEPLVIEVEDRTSRVPKQVTGDIQKMTERIQRLRQNAEALRKMGNTDEKSKERLERVLEDVKKQLEAQEKELDALRERQKTEAAEDARARIETALEKARARAAEAGRR